MSLTLNGLTDWLTLGSANPALNGKAGVTFMCWFNGPATGLLDEGILSLSIGTTAGSVNARYRMQIQALSPKNLRAQGRNGTDTGTLITMDGGATVPVSTWTHLAIATDLASATDTTKIYLNGNLDTTLSNQFTNTAWPATNSETGVIGAQSSSGTLPLTGSLADLRVYDRPLADIEIKNIVIARGADGNVHGCMHRFTLNELAPGATATAPKDGAIQARHPTVVGSPVYATHPIRTRRAYY